MIGRVPEVALVRSTLITITGIAAFVLGHQVDTSWIEAVCNIYGMLTPVLAGILIRQGVSPVVGKHAKAE
jgi:hypothetical protein